MKYSHIHPHQHLSCKRLWWREEGGLGFWSLRSMSTTHDVLLTEGVYVRFEALAGYREGAKWTITAEADQPVTQLSCGYDHAAALLGEEGRKPARTLLKRSLRCPAAAAWLHPRRDRTGDGRRRRGRT